MISERKQRLYFALFAVAVVVLIALIAFVRDQFLVTTVELTNVDPQTTLHVNGKVRSDLKPDEDGTLSVELPVGTHEVGFTRPDYWVWVKNISTERSESLTFSPFLLPQELTTETLAPFHGDYSRANTLLNKHTLPTKDDTLESPDEATRGWVDTDENRIILRWEGSIDTVPTYYCTLERCQKTLEVTHLATPIRSLDFLPGRNDVVLFAADSGIFAIEADSRGTQNFQRIYAGVAPTFVVDHGDDPHIFIRDGLQLLSASL